MKVDNTKEFVIKYTVGGFLIGLIFPFFSHFFDLLLHNYPLNFESVVHIHKSNSFHYLIDLLPIIFGGVAYYFSREVGTQLNNTENALNDELSKNKRIFNFVEKLRVGELDAKFESNGESDDRLAKSIVELRDHLVNSKKEEELRRKEDEQRNWVAEGLAKFGDILRQEIKNMEDLSYNIISNLVKYVGANQGGFFIINDDDESEIIIELTGQYAYERKKYCDKQVKWGEGLIGACILEKKTIYLKKVPDSYVNITSGLGMANPRSLVIVPLKINEEVHGVIEVASFKQYEPFEIEFIEKVAESIASTISSVKINVRTAQLLKDSQEQAETLAQQEEQMRQNMEELQATQEEAARQAEKFISFTNSVNHTLIRAEYDTNGTLLYANTKFLQKLEYSSNSEVEGKHISMFINKKDRVWFDEIWESLSKGGKHFEGDMKHVTRQGKDLWTIATYTCVRNPNGTVDKILFLAIDTTAQKKQSLDYEGQINALNRSTIKADFLPTGDFLDCNEKFQISLGFTKNDLRTKQVFDFVDKNDLIKVRNIWDDVTQGLTFDGQLLFLTADGDEKWWSCTFTSVSDMYGDVAKVIFIANDITNEKLMEIEFKKQNEMLKSQEEQLRNNEIELNRKLKQTREEVKMQFKEIEKVKVRNEKTLEGNLDAILTFNDRGDIEFFNKAAEELWGKERTEVIGRSIKVLFPDEVAQKEEFVARMVDKSQEKVIGERKEISIINNEGEEIPVLILLSEAKVGREYWITAFIQNISVDLF